MDKPPWIFYNESSPLFLFFIEQPLGVQCRFDAAECLLRRAAQGMQVHTAGHPAQQALRRIRRLLDKMVHIVPAGEVEIARSSP